MKKFSEAVKVRHLIALLFIFLIGLGYAYSPRERIDQETYIIEDVNIPKAFDGFKIVQVSDLHNKVWKSKLTNLIKEQEPDLIAITGDLVDSRKTDIEEALSFVESIKDVAPIYYVSGNHEARVDYESLKKGLLDLKVNVLEDQMIEIGDNASKISLLGVMDPAFVNEYGLGSGDIIYSKLLDDKFKSPNYTIVLSHRPEAFLAYQKLDFNLVLTGHAHGGQFIIPYFGGVIAPDQGFFPEYTQGVYKEGYTQMIVSRGLGDSILPVRLNNNYNLVTIELRSK